MEQQTERKKMRFLLILKVSFFIFLKKIKQRRLEEGDFVGKILP